MDHSRRGVLQSASAETLPACSRRDQAAVSSRRPVGRSPAERSSLLTGAAGERVSEIIGGFNDVKREPYPPCLRHHRRAHSDFSSHGPGPAVCPNWRLCDQFRQRICLERGLAGGVGCVLEGSFLTRALPGRKRYCPVSLTVTRCGSPCRRPPRYWHGERLALRLLLSASPWGRCSAPPLRARYSAFLPAPTPSTPIGNRAYRVQPDRIEGRARSTQATIR